MAAKEQPPVEEYDEALMKAVDAFEAVQIVSCDGHEFFLDRKIAFECEVLKKMYDSSLQEGQEGKITMQNVTGRILEKVLEYLYYKFKYTDCQGPIPEFQIDDEVVLDLLIAANYLQLN